MSEPILPLRQWPAGIQQASVPANDNALRLEALSRPALGVADNETTGPVDGEVWIVGSGPEGAFASFDEHDIALYHVDPPSTVGGWHAWAPVVGVRTVVDDVRMVFDGTEWIEDPSITGGGGGGVQSVVPGAGISVDDTDPANPVISATGGGGSNSYTIVTEASSFVAEPGTHDGLSTLTLAGGDMTFDSAESYTIGMTFPVRATAAMSLVEDGVTLTPPYGGTLDLDAEMAVQVVMTSPTTGIVIGQTVVLS
jgi:hypothetical protein